MIDPSQELLSRIIKARRAHAILVFILLAAILITICFFQYPSISGLFALKVVFCVVVLPIGYLTYSYVNSAFKVNCPKCNELVEQGRLPGERIPLSCKKCGLPTNGK